MGAPCRATANSFSMLLLSSPFNDLDEGNRIGKVGLLMYERFGIRNWLPRVSGMFFLHTVILGIGSL
jgi:hypothetical protein